MKGESGLLNARPCARSISLLSKLPGWFSVAGGTFEARERGGGGGPESRSGA